MSERSSVLMRWQKLALIAGTVLMGIKLTAYFLTHSNAILTDAIESIANILAGSFALYSLYIASKPKDFYHPYGHGKIEFISAGVEGGLILFAGASMAAKGLYNLWYPVEIHEVTSGIVLILIGGVSNYLLGIQLKAVGKKHHSLTLMADGEHLLTDAWSSVALLGGLLLLKFTGWVPIDNMVAVLMGCWISWTGYSLIRKSLAGVMDEADTALLQTVSAYLNDARQSDWVDIHNVRLIRFGQKVHIDGHITLPWYYNLETTHEKITDLETHLAQATGFPTECFFHADPCVPASCSSCIFQSCEFRKSTFEKRILWQPHNLTSNRKHQL
jgi:cation diffusion facilitator family transporter